MAGHSICIIFQYTEQGNMAANISGKNDPVFGTSVLKMTFRL